MPIIPVNNARYAPSLRKAISTLKAALAVSAAAILSQGKGDLEANASAALGHLDDFTAQLHAVCDDVLRQVAVPSPEADGGNSDIDGNLLTLMVGIVEDRAARLKQALYDVVGSPERDGLDAFVASVEALGTATNDVEKLLTASASEDTTPFRYDQFFLESMQDLSQRDWSAT
jgi:hypothetical protein